MAGRRLKAQLANELKSVGVREVILTTYANAYMGYIVTPEEYDQQCYEGGHTVYGRGTLTGIMKAFHYLSLKMRGESTPSDLPIKPFHFPEEELARRTT